MKKNIVHLIGILVVMSLTACSEQPEVLEGITHNVQTAQETETVTDHLPGQQDETGQSETTFMGNYNQDEAMADHLSGQQGEISQSGTAFKENQNQKEEQTKPVNNIPQNSEETVEMNLDKMESTVYDVLDHLAGEYSYTSENGNGKLIIKKTSDGYDISDYESESSYRFLANLSNIQTIEDSRIYIEYPELVYSDDTVHFSYYTLEYGTDGIDVYYGMTTPDKATFLYHATKQNNGNMEHEGNMNSMGAADGKVVDCEALGIKEYEYPTEFSMGDNLKTAIAQLAVCYESFDRDTPMTGGWKEDFIAAFIQNSRVSFDYLDRISAQNNGQISVDELNYIQYSLTNTELDFSSIVNGSIDRYEAASTFRSGSISGYSYTNTDNGVLITADLEVRYDGANDLQKYEITAELVRNPYSCFDGYSIAAFLLR